MATDSPNKFITRKEASQRCQKADRTLQRYWSRAVATRDEEILRYLKIVTEDGHERAGTEVTRDLIDDLKKQKLNPTWFVDAEWLVEFYGTRSDDDQSPNEQVESTSANANTESASQTPASFGPQYVELLRQQIEELKLDKAAMREQITQFTQTLQQNNVLQQELHTLLNGMQERLLPQPSQASQSSATIVVPQPADSSAAKESVEAEAIESKPATPKQMTPAKRKLSGKKLAAKKKAPKWYEMPTVQKVGMRLLSRQAS